VTFYLAAADQSAKDVTGITRVDQKVERCGGCPL